jgi:hypothetical protein
VTSEKDRNELMNTQSISNQVKIACAMLAVWLEMWRASYAKSFVPGTTVSLLSDPSKMPGLSFGLPAVKACPRMNGTICDSCYACKGSYVWSSTVNAQDIRFRWVRECMKSEAGMLLFVAVMTQAIARQEYFRIHDSGDFFSARYARAWFLICKALPNVKFWAPTRAWQLPNGVLPVFDPIMNTLREMAKLPNVTIRPSALNFGDNAPVVAGLHAGSSANASNPTFHCPSRSQGNQCGDCRHCWDAKDVPVDYAKH